MRGQPGEDLLFGQHRLPVRRTPARIRQEEEINRRGRLGVPLQPTGRAGLPPGRGGRWWRQRDARLGLGPRPQGSYQTNSRERQIGEGLDGRPVNLYNL